MQNPSTVSQETVPVIDLGRFSLNSRFLSPTSDGCVSFKSNFLNFETTRRRRRNSGGGSRAAVVSWGGFGSVSSNLSRFVSEFNRVVKFHCEKIPIGFASVRVGSGEDNGLNGGGVVLEGESGVLSSVVESENQKKVLILMSDTGGGHRASAEAIKAAFHDKFGDEYQVCCFLSFS